MVRQQGMQKKERTEMWRDREIITENHGEPAGGGAHY